MPVTPGQATTLLLFLSLFASDCSTQERSANGQSRLALFSNPGIETGADRIFEAPYFSWIEGKRIGLITNQTGVNGRLEDTWERLQKDSRVRLMALFSPEHGMSGALQAGNPVIERGRIYSLYGEHRAPAPEMLAEVDVLLYDIQDTGVRFYTFISTLFESLEAAAKEKIPFIVLDRPNPLNGVSVEGPILLPEFRSFVGIFPLPIRYGMTPGELALFWNAEAALGADLRVVPMKNWQRSLWYDETGLEWIPPSPNMPALTTATVYPGLGLIEGTNLSEGRGTTRPFEWVGAPWLDSRKSADELNLLKLPGARFRSQDFIPTFSKYSGELCHGVQIHVLDRAAFQPVETALHLIETVRRLHPHRFQFQSQVFDRLVGNSWVREGLENGDSVESLAATWKEELHRFEGRRAGYLLY